MMKLHVLTVPLALALGTVISLNASAQTTFNGGGDWFNAANWSAGVPTAATDAILAFSSGTATINGADASAQSLTVNFGSDLTITSNRLDVGSGGMSMTSARTVTVSSGVVLESGGGDIDRGGLFTGGGAINFSSGTLDLNNDSFLTLSGGTTLTTSATTIKTEAGSLLINGDSSWNNSGTMSVQGGSSRLDIQGASSMFSNTGTFNVTNGNTYNVNSLNGGMFQNGGLISVADNTSVVFQNFSDAGGSIQLGTGSSINTGGSLTLNGGTLSGNGTVNGSANLTVVGGNVSPGSSPGTLTIAGNLTLDNATLNIELDGAGGSMVDLLDVNGTVNLINGSDVTLTLLGSFTDPAIGTRFKFLESDSAMTTMFASTTVTAASGQIFTIGYNDGALGGTGNAYLEFAAVPEPSSLALLGIAGVGAMFRRRRS